ncbi:ribosomal protein L27 [Polyplosphaeria fusca]|uniref:Large ribosomal subunit protein bL27m n=1 Tax=Polyplosphaeria fusca TaxID=682080 RepID=A0A9P4V3H6_9PLEO|nr:ribosomal protein L27 [Polyplosphaeria fusca]
MLLPRIFAPARVSIQPSSVTWIPSSRVVEALRAANGISATSPTLSFVRHATHQAQGRANGAKDGPGKRLGAKKSGGEWVIPGNIIFRQRGTAWFPGENCAMGRDHCIYALESGYVRYYRDPLKHPERQYIGICFEKDGKLPYPPNAARRRKLNMLPVQRDLEAITADGEMATADAPASTSSGHLSMGRDYSFRQANWQIGRAAEKANVQVRQFVPGDRWRAWQKSNARKIISAEKRKLRNASKAAKAAKKKK